MGAAAARGGCGPAAGGDDRKRAGDTAGLQRQASPGQSSAALRYLIIFAVGGGWGMADMGQCDIQQHPDVGIGEPVIGHPPRPANMHHPVGAQQPQMMGDCRLAGLRDRSQIAHAHLAFQQGHQHPQPARIGQQPEHTSCLGHVITSGHQRRHHGHPVMVNDTGPAVLQTHNFLLI